MVYAFPNTNSVGTHHCKMAPRVANKRDQIKEKRDVSRESEPRREEESESLRRALLSE